MFYTIPSTTHVSRFTTELIVSVINVAVEVK